MFAANATAQEYIASFPAGDLYYSTDNKHHYIVAVKYFQPGEIITPFRASQVLHEPSRFTVQMNADEHIILDPEYLQYMNHSCDPNCFFDLSDFNLVAIKAIVPGDTLSFFYLSTEWEMAEPFHCLCGSSKCLGVIRGAGELSAEILSKYRLSPFIENKIKNK